MGIFDKIRGKDDNAKKAKPKPDLSDVRSGSSSAAHAPEVPVVIVPVAEPASVPAPKMYTVVAGDTLPKIAEREYGDAQLWRRIYEANRGIIKDPEIIYPGQSLTIPLG